MSEHEINARWLRLWTRLGASDALARADWRDLVTRYSVPQRAYHSLAHILDCQQEFDQCRHLASDPDVLEAALWYHDVVYDPRSTGNEAASAQVARQVLQRVGMSPKRVEAVERLILATRHAAVPEVGDAALMVDIDLAILGAPQQRFDRYEEEIRLEYAWVPQDVYRTKRAELLEGFLARTALFATETFRERLDSRARMNLARSIERLRRGA